MGASMTKAELQERLDRIDRSRVLAKIRDGLAYRLPQSGRPLGNIVLSREDAEELIADVGSPR
jgi:hypothetical protein